MVRVEVRVGVDMYEFSRTEVSENQTQERQILGYRPWLGIPLTMHDTPRVTIRVRNGCFEKRVFWESNPVRVRVRVEVRRIINFLGLFGSDSVRASAGDRDRDRDGDRDRDRDRDGVRASAGVL